MLRQFTLLLLAFTLLIVPTVAAQEATPEPEYNQLVDFNATFEVTDLKISLPYPEGYLVDSSDGIRVAANETDMAAGLDNDPATVATGYTMSLNAYPRNDFLAAVGLTPEATLDEAVAAFAELGGISIAEQFESPVMTYRSISVAGTSPDGRNGIAGFWFQDDYIVALGLGLADGQPLDADAGATWGILLQTVQPTVTIPEDEVSFYTSEKLGGFTIGYPTVWTTGLTDDGEDYLVENPADVAGINSEEDQAVLAPAVVITSFALAEIGLTPESTPQEIFDLLNQAGEMQEAGTPSEHVLFDQPALGVEFTDALGNQFMAIMGIVGEEGYFIVGAAPDEATFDTFKPIFIRMLNSIQPVAAE